MNQYRHIGPCLHKFANLDFSDMEKDLSFKDEAGEKKYDIEHF